MPPGEPGTLTSLLDEVFRGSEAEQAAWAEALTPGTALGRYDLIREVGRGGAGVVWEARDRELGRRVAVKVVRRPADAVPERRLVAEAEVAARLSHPGIVTTLDVGRNDKGAWLVQEFLVGMTLADRLRQGPLPAREALRIAVQVASALAYAHRHGVVHRDLSATNVFLCEDGQVKVLDLGMAQAFGRRKVEGGTAGAMAPEQVRGEPEDERVDVYALGVLLHRMLSGQAPFPPGTPVDERQPAHLEVPGAPALGDLVDRMLAAAPGARPRDAAEVLEELEGIESQLPRDVTGSRTDPVRVRRPVSRRVSRAILAIAVVAAAAIGVGAGWRAGRSDPEPRAPLAVGAVATAIGCNWEKATWIELDRIPANAAIRHGEMGGAGIAEVEGRKAWKVESDWGQMVLPIGQAGDADTFAAEVEFFIPPVTGWMRGVSLHMFTDPTGGPKTGDAEHGVVVGIGQEPGRPAFFTWAEWDGPGSTKNRYMGTVDGGVTGSWRRLRVEGSRGKRWFRVLLDGRPLVVAQGGFDLAGNSFILGAGYGYMNPEDVAYSNFRVMAGTPECR